MCVCVCMPAYSVLLQLVIAESAISRYDGAPKYLHRKIFHDMTHNKACIHYRQSMGCYASIWHCSTVHHLLRSSTL